MKRKSLRRTCMAACLGLVLGCGVAFAAENSTQNEDGAFTLGEIEVIEQTDGSPNVSVQRVTEETMRKFDTNTVSAAVNMLPGVTLSKFGARNEMMVNVRGLDTKHVPIYLDGIPIYVPYDGYPDLSRFNTFDLANITVSKGFSSVLYGPNTNLAHNSISFMIECQVGFMLDALNQTAERQARAISVTADAQTAFNAELQRKLAGTVWAVHSLHSATASACPPRSAAATKPSAGTTKTAPKRPCSAC